MRHMQRHQQRKETKDLVPAIHKKGNWKRSCNGQKTLGNLHFPEQYTRYRSHVILCNNTEKQNKQQQQQQKAIKRKMCTVEKAKTTYSIDIFYHSLPPVSELDTKQ